MFSLNDFRKNDSATSYLAYDAHLNRERPAYLAQFAEFLQIPSISTLPDHQPDVRRCAQWVAGALQDAGFDHVQVMETDGHPVVYGDWLHAPGAPTVLVYGHYDVQPVDPVEQWLTPPFEPTMRDGKVFARGAADSKGCIFTYIAAWQAMMAVEGRLPLNIRVIVEGEEEIGSPHLERWLDSHRDLLIADLAVNSDSAFYAHNVPAVVVGLRGLVGLEVTLQGANTDLHSGVFGGIAPNANLALAQLLASLVNPDGSVAVDGFYNGVEPLTEAERTGWQAVPFDSDAWASRLGLAHLSGDQRYEPLTRMWARPTLDVVGMWGGFTGAGMKTVIPCEAAAKITCRLVPNQRPEAVLDRLERHLHQHTPTGMRLTIRRDPGISRPILIDPAHPAVVAAQEALAKACGRPAPAIRAGASVPVVEVLKRRLDLDTVLLGFASPEENIHAPNEHLHLANMEAGLRALYHFWHLLAGWTPGA